MSQTPHEPQDPWGAPEESGAARSQQSSWSSGASAAGSDEGPTAAQQVPPTYPYGQAQGQPDAQQQPGHFGPAQGQYGQPGQYGQGYGGYQQAQWGASAPTPVSAIVLLVVSGISLFTGILLLAALPGIVLGIVAVVQNARNRPLSKRLTTIGWIVYAAVAVLSIAGLVLLITLGLHSTTSTGHSGVDTHFTSTALRLGR